MQRNLSDIMNDIEDVKKNVLNELAIPIQELVNMVNAGEIKSYSLVVKKIQNIGVSPYTHISVQIENPTIAILGAGEGTKEEVFGNNAKISEETQQKLLNINNVLSAVNKYLGSALPVDPKQHYMQEHLYFYSKDRKHLKKSWTPEEAAKWPMLPSFLEGLVNLNEVTTKTNKLK